MNEYQKLVAYMKILVQNLMTLHRNLRKDAAWFGNHKQIGKWYETMSEQVDDLAEMGIALGYREPSISDAVLTYSSTVLSTEPRELAESFRLCLEYFRTTAGLMQAAEAVVPVSVQNKLQEYEYYWNKEANFKLAAALGDGSDIDDD